MTDWQVYTAMHLAQTPILSSAASVEG